MSENQREENKRRATRDKGQESIASVSCLWSPVSQSPVSPFTRAIAHFNAEEYRAALLAFEELWHAERSDFLRALIQLCNALNQLRLGLVTAPRRSLASADALLAGCLPFCEGLDVAVLRAYIAAVRASIPAGLETGAGRVDWADVPRIRLDA